MDADPLVRLGLTSLLRNRDDVTLVGEAAGVDEAVRTGRMLKPDVLLRPSCEDGAEKEQFRVLREELPETRTIVIGEEDDPMEVRAAFAAGAEGFIVREHVRDQLDQALAAVSRGQPFLDPAVGGRLAATFAGAGREEPGGATGAERLTLRELEVLQLLSRGLTNAEIGAQLGISFRTVERHRGALRRKLGVGRRSELVQYARRHHLA